MDIVGKLRGRSEYERHLGVELIYLYHMDVENICKEIERLREALKEIDKAIETWLPDHSPMRQALQNFTRSALQQKDSE